MFNINSLGKQTWIVAFADNVNNPTVFNFKLLMRHQPAYEIRENLAIAVVNH